VAFDTKGFGERTFAAIFNDYGMWFSNHIIKIENKDMMSIDHPLEICYAWGDDIVYRYSNQEGVDIVLPVCHMTPKLGPDSVTAIIVQVKNAKDYEAALQGHLFDAMDTVVKSTIFCKLSEPGVDCDCEPTTETRAKPDKKRRKVTPPEPVKAKVKPKAVIRVVMMLASPEPATVFNDRCEKRRLS
jgi:hypothetical protein